jgi:hypothetical protein
VVFEAREVSLLLKTAGLLERANRGLGVRIDVEGEGGERLGTRVVEEPALLEEERDIGLSADLE